MLLSLVELLLSGLAGLSRRLPLLVSDFMWLLAFALGIRALLFWIVSHIVENYRNTVLSGMGLQSVKSFRLRLRRRIK